MGQTGRVRVLRGGSWNNNPENCRVANRNRNNPNNRNNNVGFRVVRDFRGAYPLARVRVAQSWAAWSVQV
ncbi:MAG: SUMF1/EgtB/PvdO family nonheme iron enzyme [Saprospiraceae bacterium]